MWTAAILAGGHARRLGRDKSALLVGADSILDRQLAMLRTLTPHILIVARHRPAVESDVRVVEDHIEAPTEQVLVIACDMPFVSAPFLKGVAALGEDVDAAIPSDGKQRHPLCASYQRRIAAHLKMCIDAGELRIGDALRDLHVRDVGPDQVAPFDPDGRLLLNVNTPADYERARLAAANVPPPV